MDIDLGNVFTELETNASNEYRNPMEAPYGDVRLNTRSQNLAWQFFKRRSGNSPVMAMVGAKGSGKTHFGSAFAFHQGQRFEGSMGCCISNTYQQAKDNAGALFAAMAARLNYSFEFFTKKKINGRPYTSLFVVDLDGLGFNTGKRFYMLVRSFDAVNKLEGIELDWLWIEELQDAEKEAFSTVVSRVRGKGADQAIFIAGMPHDEFHWQYKMIPRLGAIEENKVREELGYDPFDIDKLRDSEVIPHEELPLWESEARGILFEPTVYENKKNVPETYIPNLYNIYDTHMADRYIFGKRTSLLGNKILHQYNDGLHRTGIMSELLCKYDPSLQIILSIDFNTSPMSATLWQIKGWNDEWNEAYINKDTGKFEILDEITKEPIETYDTLEEYASPDRDILAQIDEFEVWEGGTDGLMREFKRKYANREVQSTPSLAVYDRTDRRVCHHNGIIILGDATGNRLYTSADRTDWQIIRSNVVGLPSVTTVQGLITNSNFKTGEVKYSNPGRRATINNLNASLRDAAKRVHICFMPVSPYMSGGAARSCALMVKTGDGRVDDSNDKQDSSDREIARTHFFDSVRYVSWWFRGSETGITADVYDQAVKSLDRSTRTAKSTFVGGSRFGTSWGSVF